jgi:hypothetical protein
VGAWVEAWARDVFPKGAEAAVKLAVGIVLFITGLGMIFAALPNRAGVPRAFLSGSVEMFYPVVSIALMTFGIALIVSGALLGT